LPRVVDATTFDPGELVGYMMLQTLEVAPAEAENIEFILSAENRKSVDLFHEKAGLFAYAETLGSCMKWDDQRPDQEVSLAVQNVPATCEASGADINQVAVYDLEAKQWHFVALADLATKPPARPTIERRT
jgi:hypothetical protein